MTLRQKTVETLAPNARHRRVARGVYGGYHEFAPTGSGSTLQRQIDSSDFASGVKVFRPGWTNARPCGRYRARARDEAAAAAKKQSVGRASNSTACAVPKIVAQGILVTTKGYGSGASIGSALVV
jgi:hypothetical protein